MENTKVAAKRDVGRLHTELGETIGRIETRLGQLKSEEIIKLETKLNQLRKLQDELQREMSKTVQYKTRMDFEWDAYRHSIQEDYLPTLLNSGMSQEEYDTLLDGYEERVRDFYAQWGACEKQEPGCIRTCDEVQDCNYANRTANAIVAQQNRG